MTNAKVYQGFHDDKKVEEHWFRTGKFALLSCSYCGLFLSYAKWAAGVVI